MLIKVLFVLLLSNIADVSAKCKILDINDCHGIQEISSFKLYAFISQDEYQETCKKLGIALNCIYQSDKIKDCDKNTTLLFDVHRSVVNEVCKSGSEGKSGVHSHIANADNCMTWHYKIYKHKYKPTKPEYPDHTECLGNSGMEDRMNAECLQSTILAGNTDCTAIQDARRCLRTTARNQCGPDTGEYMDLLAYRLFTPSGNIMSCNLALPNRLRATRLTAATTIAGRSSMTSSRSTSTSGTTTIESNTTTESSTSPITAPSPVFILVVALCSFIFRHCCHTPS